MAISLLQDDRDYEATSDTSFGVAFGSNCASGSLIVVTVGAYHDSATIDSVTDTLSTSYSAVGSLLRAGDSPSPILNIYYGTTTSSGANTVTATFSAALADKEIKIFELSGAAGTLDQTNGGTGDSTEANSGSITTTVDNSFIIGVCQEFFWTTHDHTASTPSTGWTEFGDTATGSSSCHRIETSTGSFTAAFGMADFDDWACVIASFGASSADVDSSANRIPISQPYPYNRKIVSY